MQSACHFYIIVENGGKIERMKNGAAVGRKVKSRKIRSQQNRAWQDKAKKTDGHKETETRI